MEKIIAVIVAISLLNIAQSVLPPTKVVVFESAACGLCKYFNYLDVSFILSRPNYSQVVQVSLNPTIHFRKIIKADKTVTFEHQFGSQFLRVALTQICINNLYDNEKALRWASKTSYSKNTIEDDLKVLFPEDQGKRILECVNGPEAHKHAEVAFNQMSKSGLGGRLPLVALNDEKKVYVWDKNSKFLESICRLRSDKNELVACNGIKQAELEFLIEESYYNPNQEFDYAAFWNSPDDD